MRRLAACLAQAGRAHWHHLALADSRECWAESLNWQDSTVVRGWLDEAERLLARAATGETPPPAPEMDNPRKRCVWPIRLPCSPCRMPRPDLAGHSADVAPA